MRFIAEHAKAINLRKNGYSIPHIAKELSVSKSTASLWCRKVKLTKDQIHDLQKGMLKGLASGRLKAAEIKRSLKLNTIEKYAKEGIEGVGRLSARDLLMVGIGLYWGEGSKNGKLSFINSDPVLIKFMMVWFQKVFALKKEDFMPRIFINHSHKYRSDQVINFWSKQLNLPKTQFGNITLLKIKSKKRYPNHDTYFGVLALRIRRGTNNLYRMLGLIGGVKHAIRVYLPR